MLLRASVTLTVLLGVLSACSESGNGAASCAGGDRGSDSPAYVCYRQAEYHRGCAPAASSRLGEALGTVESAGSTESYQARAILDVDTAEAIAIKADLECSELSPKPRWLVATRSGLANDRVTEILEAAAED